MSLVKINKLSHPHTAQQLSYIGKDISTKGIGTDKVEFLRKQPWKHFHNIASIFFHTENNG